MDIKYIEEIYNEVEKILKDKADFEVVLRYDRRNKDSWKIGDDYYLVIEVYPYDDYLDSEDVVKIIELGKKLGYKVRIYGRWDEVTPIAFMFYKKESSKQQN